ncbi:MAG: molybdopterin-binding protein, partial [Burkholderiales bacterium]|nr:molybdopterin-binding protein [Burkholderiales bacterium]
MGRKLISSGHARPRTASRRAALRTALASVGTLALAGCDRLSNNAGFVDVLTSAQDLSRVAQRAVAGRNAMAQEFSPADVAAHFRTNGTLMPVDADYQALLRGGFTDWKLQVGGLVEAPAEFTLAQLRAMPSRTQITRHDCVEGWSSIGKWKGVQLSHVLAQVRPLASARFVVFRCADSMDGPSLDGHDSRYYESIDLDEAHHVQTLLAYELNDQPLPVANGAPLRARVERQLGYKQAKYVMRVEMVESLSGIGQGSGGYWEDRGYE